MSQPSLAVDQRRKELDWYPPGHRHRPSSLIALADALRARYEVERNLQDLADAITFSQEAISLCPDRHSGRASALDSLTKALTTRYESEGNPQDLVDTIAFCQESLSLRPSGHLNRASSLTALAYVLGIRYHVERNKRDLVDMIAFYQEALPLRPGGHPEHAPILQGLARAFKTRYEADGNIQDLFASVALDRQVHDSDDATAVNHEVTPLMSSPPSNTLNAALDSRSQRQCEDTSKVRPPDQVCLTEGPATETKSPGVPEGEAQYFNDTKRNSDGDSECQISADNVRPSPILLATSQSHDTIAGHPLLSRNGLAPLSDGIDPPPPSGDIGHLITAISPNPINVSGGFGDLFSGMHATAGKVALKRPRISSELEHLVHKEATTWQQLRHPHVLQFLGVATIGGHIHLTSPYVENGTLRKYIELHPEVDRQRLLRETADAVAFLHSSNVIHGDIKGNNILISDTVHALLCDFGLSKGVESKTASARKGAGSPSWQSPEILVGAPKSFMSDVYGFGMTIIEILTGQNPFAHIKNHSAIIYAVIEGVRPSRPTTLSAACSAAWNVADRCCLADAKERPDMEYVSSQLDVTM